MQYSFHTKISARGLISVPNEIELLNKKVRVILIPETPKSKKTFTNKWAGAFSLSEDSSDEKYNALLEKHNLK